MTTHPRPASSVVLAREAEGGPEVLMLKRHGDRDFGGAWVYPGGLLEPDDDDAEWAHCVGRDVQVFDDAMSTRDGLSYYIAAIRELYEESGLLLADPSNEGGKAKDLFNQRRRLVAREQTFAQFCASSGWRPDVDALEYFDFWVTPAPKPKRYSTRFFAARFSEIVEVIHDEREATDHQWITPLAALRLRDAGRLMLAPPQHVTLSYFAHAGSVDELLALARARRSNGIEAFEPQNETQARQLAKPYAKT